MRQIAGISKKELKILNLFKIFGEIKIEDDGRIFLITDEKRMELKFRKNKRLPIVLDSE